MNCKTINELRKQVSKNLPLIHCITNPISINQCANAVLAVGARPIMAQHPFEVAEITATAKALMLNLGNITETRIKSMEISAHTAHRNNIPFVLDMVGVACSQLRLNFAVDIVEKYTPTVIKGNYSEIGAFYNPQYKCAGVDAQQGLDAHTTGETAAQLAKKYGTVVLASGKTDIVTDGNTIVYINNGTPQLAKITGTGCMQGALCACYLSAGNGLVSAATACAVLGICGQLAQTDKGNGSFMVNLMDKLSLLTDVETEELLEMEVKEFE